MKILPPPSPEFVNQVLANDTDWDFSNRVLYDLCENHPEHREDGVIMAKIMLIGRAYAATIERRRKSKTGGASGDEFQKAAARRIRESDIDIWLRVLRESPTDKNSETENLVLDIETHARVTRLFRDISKLDKRSLASKYLHFHFPRRFYIFDTRAKSAISQYTRPIRTNRPKMREPDDEYANFYLRCEDLNNRMSRRLSPRELDKVLLANK